LPANLRGLVHDVLPAATIVSDLVGEMDEILGYSAYRRKRASKAVS
jgi:hypothetical protein